MECLMLSEHPHFLNRYEQWRKALRADGSWCALFKTKGYRRMQRHQVACSQSFRGLITRHFDLCENDRFIVTTVRTLGYVVIVHTKEHFNGQKA